MHALPLQEWESFYVIVGSSGAALTGLMFVVVALQAERKASASEAVPAFGTPTVVHFCAVLLISALLSMPGQTARSLSLCLLAAGGTGLALEATVVRRARRQKAYRMVPEDWIWHVFLPLVAYLALVAAAILLRFQPAPALYLIAAVALLLLFIGIHNAWDSAVWFAAAPKP